MYNFQHIYFCFLEIKFRKISNKQAFKIQSMGFYKVQIILSKTFFFIRMTFSEYTITCFTGVM